MTIVSRSMMMHCCLSGFLLVSWNPDFASVSVSLQKVECCVAPVCAKSRVCSVTGGRATVFVCVTAVLCVCHCYVCVCTCVSLLCVYVCRRDVCVYVTVCVRVCVCVCVCFVVCVCASCVFILPK